MLFTIGACTAVLAWVINSAVCFFRPGAIRYGTSPWLELAVASYVAIWIGVGMMLASVVLFVGRHLP
jgi:hypothetical protein